jgi:hypothetical protein
MLNGVFKRVFCSKNHAAGNRQEAEVGCQASAVNGRRSGAPASKLAYQMSEASQGRVFGNGTAQQAFGGFIPSSSVSSCQNVPPFQMSDANRVRFSHLVFVET